MFVNRACSVRATWKHLSSQQKTSVLSREHIVCVSETSQGPDTCNRDGSRQPYSNSSNRPHPPRQNRGAVLMGRAVWRVTEKPKKIKWQWGQDVSCSTRSKIGEGCRKWSQNGRQGLSRKPRGSGGRKTVFADGPGARRGRQRPVSAKLGVPPASSIVGLVSAMPGGGRSYLATPHLFTMA